MYIFLWYTFGIVDIDSFLNKLGQTFYLFWLLIRSYMHYIVARRPGVVSTFYPIFSLPNCIPNMLWGLALPILCLWLRCSSHKQGEVIINKWRLCYITFGILAQMNFYREWKLFVDQFVYSNMTDRLETAMAAFFYWINCFTWHYINCTHKIRDYTGMMVIQHTHN
jgi:hypothetical protein